MSGFVAGRLTIRISYGRVTAKEIGFGDPLIRKRYVKKTARDNVV